MKKREWKFKMKKDLIADAAADLFLEKGVENVTLSEIASQVGYSKSSLYSYFKSRDDIISYLVELADEEFQEIESFITEQLKKSSRGSRNPFSMSCLTKAFERPTAIKRSPRSFTKTLG